MDSTGIRFCGDGERLARERGASRRRQRRNVDILTDAGTGDVRAVEFSSSGQGESPLLPELLSQRPSDEPVTTVPSRQFAAQSLAGQWTVPMTRGGVMGRSSNEGTVQSYPSVETAAPRR